MMHVHTQYQELNITVFENQLATYILLPFHLTWLFGFMLFFHSERPQMTTPWRVVQSLFLQWVVNLVDTKLTAHWRNRFWISLPNDSNVNLVSNKLTTHWRNRLWISLPNDSNVNLVSNKLTTHWRNRFWISLPNDSNVNLVDTKLTAHWRNRFWISFPSRDATIH